MLYQSPFHTDSLNYRFLVTGGAGFIGSHIVEYLLQHQAKSVVVLDNLDTGFRENLKAFEGEPNFRFIEGDICRLEDCQKACEGVDIVLHQAALGSVPRSIQDPLRSNAVNVGGFLNMLVAARDQSVSRFVYAASSSTYGDSKTLPKVEEQIGRPLSPYAVTKYVNELYADVFARTYGLSIIGLRYFNVFGPRQSPRGPYAAVIPLFAEALLNNQAPLIHGDGEQTRDFTFVANAVQANIRAALIESEAAANQVYNIAFGERTSLNQLFQFLKEEMNSPLEAQYGPPRPGDVRDSLANIQKAQKYLHYKPTFSVKEGLKITLDWFKNLAP